MTFHIHLFQEHHQCWYCDTERIRDLKKRNMGKPMVFLKPMNEITP